MAEVREQVEDREEEFSPGPAVPWGMDLVKVGAVAAFLLLATAVAAILTVFTVPTSETPTDDTLEFLRDIANNKNQAMAAVWLFAFLSPLMVVTSLGLYYALRRWGEWYMRLVLIFAVGAAILLALATTPLAVLVAYVAPAWAEAEEDATRTLLFLDARSLAWLSGVMLSMFGVMLAIAVGVAGLVMQRGQGRLWPALGWLGILGGVASFVGAFGLAEERFDIADFISVVLLLIWVLGVGVALWRQSAAEAAVARGYLAGSPPAGRL